MESVDFESFKKLLRRKDADWELNEIDGELDQNVLREWLVTIIRDWPAFAKELTHKEQNRALWRICGNPFFVGFWLADRSDLTFEQQQELVRAAANVTLAIPSLFEPDEPMENGYYMWWDMLAESIKDLPLATICLEILKALSKHKDERVWVAALHGLGHLDHPDRPAVVNEFLQYHPELKDDPWILQCREGTVM